MYSDIFLNSMFNELEKLAKESDADFDEEEDASKMHLLPDAMTPIGTLVGGLGGLVAGSRIPGIRKIPLSAGLAGSVLGGYGMHRLGEGISNAVPTPITNTAAGGLAGAGLGTLIAAMMSKGKINPSALRRGAKYGAGGGALTGLALDRLLNRD